MTIVVAPTERASQHLSQLTGVPGCQIVEFMKMEFNAILDDQGKPWFIAHEVAYILGLDNERYSTRYLKPEDSTTAHQLLKGRKVKGLSKNTRFLSRRGFFKMMMRSKRPEAELFEEWVWDVIDNVIDHGFCGTPATIEAMLQNPGYAIEKLKQLKASQQVDPAKAARAWADEHDSAIDMAKDILQKYQ